MVKFLHTADWQLGKPFASVPDPEKRAHLQNERLMVIRRMATWIVEHELSFVVVAGDLFDSSSPSKMTLSAACSEIGALQVPVFVIPGNHDHGGTGGVWKQAFFERERDALAPNLRVLLQPEPIEIDTAVLLPCPLLRRHESSDLTQWLRFPEDLARFGDKPRIVIAHGSVTDFGGFSDDDESDGNAVNFLDLARLSAAEFDYIALGDWHGAKQVAADAWYSGTPELDRFVKGGDHDPGNVLIVNAERGRSSQITQIKSGAIRWHELAFDFADDDAIDALQSTVVGLIGARVNQDLLRLQLNGTLGIAAATRLEQLLDTWTSRLIRLKLENQTTLAPTADEVNAMTCRAGDPLVSRVATRLCDLAVGESDEAAVARVALRELFAVCHTV